MAEPDRLPETSAVAVRHGSLDHGEDARLIGIVRRPYPWFLASLDEDILKLGPPSTFAEECKPRTD